MAGDNERWWLRKAQTDVDPAAGGVLFLRVCFVFACGRTIFFADTAVQPPSVFCGTLLL